MIQPCYFKNGDDFPHLDDAARRRNFDLCQAVNLTRLGIVLDALIAAGMPAEQAKCFKASADSLLALMRTENHRISALQERRP